MRHRKPLSAPSPIVAPDSEWRQLQRICDNASTAFLLTDERLRCIYLNPAASKLTGFDAAEAVGRSLHELVPAEAALFAPVADANPGAGALSSRQRTRGIDNFVRKNGESYRAMYTATPLLRAGELEGVLLEVRELAKEREVDLAARKREAQLRVLASIVEHSGDLIALGDANHKPFYVNEAGRRLIGIEPGQLQRIDLLECFAPEDWPFIQQVAIPALHRDGHWSGEVRLRHFKTGEIIPTLWNAFAIKDPAGRTIAWANINPDLRRLKRAEQGLIEKEAKLRHSLEQLKMALRAANAGTFTWDMASDTMESSEELLQLYGAKARKSVVPRLAWIKNVVPEDREHALAAFDRAARGQDSEAAEFRIRRIDNGELRWIEARVHVVRDRDGKAVRMIGINTDVTERKLAEQERERLLREMEQQQALLRTVIDYAPAAVAVLRGAEHRFAMVNTAQVALAGGRPDLVGRTVAEVWPRGVNRQLRRMLDQVYRSGQPLMRSEQPLTIARAQGTEQGYFDLTLLPLRGADDSVTGVLMFALDVSEPVQARKNIEILAASLRRANAELREGEERLRTLADNIPQLAWMADADGWPIWYNRRWYEYTGIAREELQDHGWKNLQHPEHVQRVVSHYEANLRAGTIWEDSFPLRSRDGGWRWFLARAIPIRDDSGRVIRWFGTFTDIHDQKVAEEALRRSNADLEQFAYVAGHDLQEPLRKVALFTQLLLRKIDAREQDPELERYADYIRTGVEQAQLLVKDLLTYSRTIHATLEEAARTADLERSLELALAALAEQIARTHADIAHDPLPRVRGDERQLGLVFQNLISNALKYQPPGQAPRVRIATTRLPTHWKICVRDNGIGFSPEHAEKIFDLFQRLHKDDYPGTGLGLAICRRVVERAGGRIWAESRGTERGGRVGATFCFTLAPADDDRP